MLWLLALTSAALSPRGDALEHERADVQESDEALGHIMNNVEAVQAKTAAALNKMEKESFFALPKDKWLDPGPEKPRSKGKAAPSSLLQESPELDSALKKLQDSMTVTLPESKGLEDKGLEDHAAKLGARAQEELNKVKGMDMESQKAVALSKQRAKEAMVEIAKLRAANEKNKAKTAPSSFAQISDSPDDGFAKVEAKLKALQEKIKADTAKFEQEAKAAPSSFVQQGEKLNVEGLGLELGSSTLAQTQEAFQLLNHKMDNVKKMQASTAQAISKMQQDSFFNPGAHPVAPTSLIQENGHVTVTQSDIDKLKADDETAQGNLQVDEDKYHSAMEHLESVASRPWHEKSRFKDLENRLESIGELRGSVQNDD
jgi:hypothetical protein